MPRVASRALRRRIPRRREEEVKKAEGIWGRMRDRTRITAAPWRMYASTLTPRERLPQRSGVEIERMWEVRARVRVPCMQTRSRSRKGRKWVCGW